MVSDEGQVLTSKLNAQFQLSDIAKLFDFELNDNSLTSISTDSREIVRGQVFLPLLGERFDGHDFINEVLDSGILYSFCERKKLYKVNENYKENRLIIVEDTLSAYHRLANYYRKKVNPKVIAITGSSGKTTVKDLIVTVLSTKYRVHKTEASFNNEIGAPKTILDMPQDTQVLVLELAMRKEGEISYLSKTAQPDIGVITNVGTAHIGRLGSRKSIIKAKCELLENLRQDGTAILPDDKELLDYSKNIWGGKIKVFDLKEAIDVTYKEERSYFIYKRNNYSISAGGRIHVLNSLCTILLAEELKLSVDEIRSGLSAFQVPQGRGNVFRIKEDVYIVDESYNANPDSVKIAVNNAFDLWDKDYSRILVLGELAELGEHDDMLLEELNNWFLQFSNLEVITVGGKLKQVSCATNVKSTEDCCNLLGKMMKPKSVVIVKGSHIACLDKVVGHFTGDIL